MARVALLVTCVVDVLEPEVGEAAVRVLRAAGDEVVFPADQTCCGQPAWNSGFVADAARVARTTLAALEQALDAGAETVVCPAGSCTTMVRRFWPELFALAGDDGAAERARAVGARTREFGEHLAERVGDLPLRAGAPPEPVALHASCHLLRELRVDGPAEALVRAAGFDVVGWSAAERCCGFGGMFSFRLPEVAEAMADDKLASLAAEAPGVRTVVGSDPSCLLHLRARSRAEGRPVEVRHVAQVLDAALDRAQ